MSTATATHCRTTSSPWTRTRGDLQKPVPSLATESTANVDAQCALAERAARSWDKAFLMPDEFQWFASCCTPPAVDDPWIDIGGES